MYNRLKERVELIVYYTKDMTVSKQFYIILERCNVNQVIIKDIYYKLEEEL